METTVYQSNTNIFHKSLDLLISSILNNNNMLMIRNEVSEKIVDLLEKFST